MKIETVYITDHTDEAAGDHRIFRTARVEMPEDYDPEEVTWSDVVHDEALREVDEGAPYEILSLDGDVVLMASPGTTYTHLEDAEEALDAWREQDPDGLYWISDYKGEKL